MKWDALKATLMKRQRLLLALTDVLDYKYIVKKVLSPVELRKLADEAEQEWQKTNKKRGNVMKALKQRRHMKGKKQKVIKAMKHDKKVMKKQKKKA